jgi:hypothetical protein
VIKWRNFTPRRSEKLTVSVGQYCSGIYIEASQSDSFPRPLNAQIHVSSEDWQSGPEGVVAFGSAVGIPVTVVDGEGHMMSVDYVGGVLDTHLR